MANRPETWWVLHRQSIFTPCIEQFIKITLRKEQHWEYASRLADILKNKLENKTKTNLFKKLLSDNTQIYPWCRGLLEAEIKLGVVFAMQKNQNKNIPAKRKKEREKPNSHVMPNKGHYDRRQVCSHSYVILIPCP